MSQTQLPPIIATMIGDPGGVGPEVAVKALATAQPHGCSRPLLIGSAEAVSQAAKHCGLAVSVNRVARVEDARFEPGEVDVLDDGALAPGELSIGKPSAAAGRAVRRWLDLSSELAHAGAIAGWIMAPIDRTSLKLGVGMGDDEEVAPPGTFLLRVNRKLRVVPLSEHTLLRDVPATVKAERVHALIGLVHQTLERWGLQQPRIAVAGLNPHARGDEEREAIKPAVDRAQAEGIRVSGPVSPDSVFRQCIEGRHDVVISMYHDQGQIALKTSAFEGACSIYLGLPFVHLTVPHGSAMDIAGQGIAKHAGMLAAMVTAASLAAGRYSVER